MTCAPMLQQFQPQQPCRKHTYILTPAPGVDLQLHRLLRNDRGPAVLLLHGLTTSAEMFVGAEWYGLAEYLLDHGYGDVWLLDWRGSAAYGRQFVHEDFTVEELARVDLPLALAQMRAVVGSRDIHLIGHCIGAMGAAMALADRRIDGIKSAILANVGLFPRLELGSLWKLLTIPPLAQQALGINHFSVNPADIDLQSAEYLYWAASQAGSNRCDNPTCRLLSFIWGSGHESTIFKHEHLHPKTHDRLHHYFGPVSIHYFQHFRKMLLHAAVVADDRHEPTHYLDRSGQINTPLLLCVGAENRCWYDSIQQYHSLLQQHFPQQSADLFVAPGYSHNDLFMGVAAYRDVFPQLLAFLDQHH